MRTFLALTRLYIRTVYSLPRRGGAAKPTWKEVLKTVGFVLLGLYLSLALGGILVMLNLAQYDALAPLGLQGILLLNAVVMATIAALVFGFLMALSTWYLSNAERLLQALPIGPRALLGAKFALVYLSELVLSLLLMGIALVIFGIRERPPLPFYLHGLVAALCAPLLPLALSYLTLSALMSAGRLLRNKNALLLLGGVLGIGVALAFNVYYQRAVMMLRDPAWILGNLADPDALLGRIGAAWPPAWLAWRALSESAGLGALLCSLANLALGLGGAALVVLALGPAYAASLRGFGELRLKRLAVGRVEAFMLRRITARPLWLTLLKREINLMNRDPMYLLNGPFIIVLMPLILAIVFLVQKEAFAAEFAALDGLASGTIGLLAAAGASAFLGASTSITCTSVSRDAKMLPAIKALPIEPAAYFLAKYRHGLLFAAFGALSGGGLVSLALRLPLAQALLALAMGLSLSACLNLIGLYIDMAWPRLRWDNPLAALKQNPNAVIAMLGGMALIGLLSFAGGTLARERLGAALIFGGGPLCLSAVGLAFLPRYARKRFQELEP